MAKRKATRSSARLKGDDVVPEEEEQPKKKKRNDASTPAPTDDGPNYWLLKAEPETRIEKGKDMKFSIDDLAQRTSPEPWDGVRNYAARNHLRSMKRGDLGFFYHSNCATPGIAGILEIVGEATVDETAFDATEPYYDPKSRRDAPKWVVVHVAFREKFRRLIGLRELKALKEQGKGGLERMPLLTAARLSVSPVPRECWEFIVGLAEEEEEEGAQDDDTR